MSFSLSIKPTNKFSKFKLWGKNNAIYGSETVSPAPRHSELLGSNSLSQIWDTAQHNGYFLAILETYEVQDRGSGYVSEDSRAGAKITGRNLSFSLHKKNGRNYEQILTTKPPTLVSQSLYESTVDDLYFNTDKSFVATVNHPSLNKSEITKFNKKGKVLWSSSKLPGYTGGSYDLTVDQKGDIYVSYSHKIDGFTLAKVNGRNGDVLWSSQTAKENTSISNVAAAANSVLLVDDDSALVVASGHFPDSYSGTRAFTFNTATGSIMDSQDIDGDTYYSQFELFTQGDTAYLRTTIGAYSLGDVVFDTKISSDSQSDSKGRKDLDTLKAPSRFSKKYVDKLTNFNLSTDTLEIDIDSFGINSSATFKVGKNSKFIKKKLARKDFDFLYDEKKGGLYFNENGSDKGFGDGGIIAILKGAPDLTSSNLEFV